MSPHGDASLAPAALHRLGNRALLAAPVLNGAHREVKPCGNLCIRALPSLRHLANVFFNRQARSTIFYVDLTLAVFAMIGSRIASDAQRNVFDLRASVERLSVANLELTKAAEALRRSESLPPPQGTGYMR